MTDGAKRRRLFTLAGSLGLVAALQGAATAQPGARVVRLGFLTAFPHAERETAFRRELERLGYREGVNLVIEYRSANGNFDRLSALAAELVQLKVDVFVAVVTQAALAAKGATTTIPIVMVGVADPVGAGLVASLARPGANVTGNSGANVDLVGKQLELLHELLPNLSRVVVLRNPANSVFQAQQSIEAETAARRLGIELQVAEARHPDALDDAFRAMPASRGTALLVLADPMFAANAERIARLAVERRLPTASGFAVYVDAGMLLAYGSDLEESHRRAAVYVDRLLKGTKPADLPVERPTRFELILNARTAKALGITLPPSLAARADRVVQ